MADLGYEPTSVFAGCRVVEMTVTVTEADGSTSMTKREQRFVDVTKSRDELIEAAMDAMTPA